MMIPERIDTEAELDDVMTTPSVELMRSIAELRSPLVVLGGSGKMGPSLAALARRAALAAGTDLEVIAVARFSDDAARRWLHARGIGTIPCDLLDRAAVMRLPASNNVVYMAGRKFGTQDNPGLTWAMNALPPAWVAERYAGGRIVALSTGCVYPLVPVAQGGSREQDELTPVGEYANACVARERVFEYVASRYGVDVVQIRLNYALDLRYGVFVDIGSRVAAGQPVDLAMGWFNAIWQRDANDMILRAFGCAGSPQRALNLTSRAVLSVRTIAERFGALMGRPVTFTGVEAETALLSDPSQALQILGEPPTPLDTVLQWTAAWLTRGGRTLGRPTHFEVADGRY